MRRVETSTLRSTAVATRMQQSLATLPVDIAALAVSENLRHIAPIQESLVNFRGLFLFPIERYMARLAHAYVSPGERETGSEFPVLAYCRLFRCGAVGRAPRRYLAC